MAQGPQAGLAHPLLQHRHQIVEMIEDRIRPQFCAGVDKAETDGNARNSRIARAVDVIGRIA